MDQSTIAEQTTEFVELLQRAQALAQRAGANAAAKASGKEFSVLDAGTIAQAYARAGMQLAADPFAISRFQVSLMTDTTKAWMKAWSGGTTTTADRRFRDEKWAGDPFSRALRDVHLAIEGAAEQLIGDLPDADKDSLRVRFYTRQLLSALSPTNYLALNPVARDRFLETEGRSLLDGFRNLLDDLERGDGRLDIDMTDRAAFEVGRHLATTPGEVIYQNDLMQLIHYRPLTETQHKRPLLFVPPWINKYYIFDMKPDNSMVRFMLEQGHSVFLISWVNPTKKHARLSFEDYMRLGPLEALDRIEESTGRKEFDILGFCIGGILVTATLAYMAAKGDKRVKTATTLATMVDFTDVGEIGVFIDRERLEVLREHMAEKGYLENHHLQDMFSMIRENDLIWSFHVMNYLMGRKPPAFDLLFWNGDSTRLPADMLLWYLEKIYIENGLRQPGHLTMDGVPIDISKIKIPFYVLATKEDHIAPWRSIYPTTGLLGGDTSFVLGGSGHIAGVINPPGKRPKYGFWTGDDYAEDPGEWLAGAEKHEGSWWPHWANWIEGHSPAKRVAALDPDKGKLAPVEAAPGSYVRAG
ncbi:class I poly(R)-hydroxyalkanoic acid synthase [Paracoccus aurantiacus]|uniref:Class I poly(R)-hydroxyalkanoic acid synthase n=1 Tax=Paracoccus aurantiacus TaxID=2599412 RepID=A0A5C6S0Z4_9RHOB|nr:class I poly(R)-hydroxyalkanoic acid synthase [Paracoccus aurantiacus]TXB68201.1 class I poly(R)-hydroxyalkanoic acid synthase [Paracoccus aurantiacus]